MFSSGMFAPLFPRGSRALVLSVLALSAVAFQARGQAVISTRSGVLHYFEGAVYLNDQPVEPHPGRFLSVPEGSELRTAAGRAEVLLTPGVFLRLDQNSSIRMVSNTFADSRVELLTGSAMVESAEPTPGTSVTLSYQGWQVRFPEKGVYRIDSTPARVWVREGQAQVTDAATGEPVAVDRGMDLPLAIALVPEQSAADAGSDPGSGDALSNWSRGRADSISADNQIAANIQDPASMDMSSDPSALYGDPGQYGFTQFPMLGLAPIDPGISSGIYSPYGAGVYSSVYPYQSGFYALYLPGYTYRPLFLGLPTVVGRSSTIYSPLPRTGYTVITPRSVYSSPTVIRPTPPVSRPVVPISRPAPIVHAPVAAPHVGGHPH
jgi:hypothetical protein